MAPAWKRNERRAFRFPVADPAATLFCGVFDQSRFLCFFAAPFGVRFLRVECFRGGRPLAPLYMPMTVGRYVRGFKLAAKTNVLAACKTLGIPPSKLDDGQNRCPPAPAAVRTPRFHRIAAPAQRCAA